MRLDKDYNQDDDQNDDDASIVFIVYSLSYIFPAANKFNFLFALLARSAPIWEEKE